MPFCSFSSWKTLGFCLLGSRIHKPGVAGSSPAAAIVTTERLVLGQAPGGFAAGCAA